MLVEGKSKQTKLEPMSLPLNHLSYHKPTTFFYFFRRSSFVQMTGLDVDAEKDQESLAASAVASEMLDAPTPR